MKKHAKVDPVSSVCEGRLHVGGPLHYLLS